MKRARKESDDTPEAARTVIDLSEEVDEDPGIGDIPVDVDAMDIKAGAAAFVHELFPAASIHSDDMASIKGFLNPAGTQNWGSDTFQKTAADTILDFFSDGMVLCVHAVTITGLLELSDAVNGRSFSKILQARQLAVSAGRLKEARLEESDYIRTIRGMNHKIPINDPEKKANVLRQVLCENTFRDTGLVPSDFPIKSRSNPFPYKTIVFFIPNNQRHFSVIIYYAHGDESDDPDRAETWARFVNGKKLGGDGEANLYIYDSASGLNNSQAMIIAKMLAEDMRLFNDSGKFNFIDVFNGGALQTEASCSSWSVYFAERAKEACLARRYSPLLRSDFAVSQSIQDSACAVSVLRMMIERIDTDSRWWGDTSTSNPGKLRQVIESFVSRRVRFRGGTFDQARAAELINALVRMYTHDLPSGKTVTNYKFKFITGDEENTTLLNPDIIRLYLLMALTVPNGVIFSTDLDSIAERWTRTRERYEALIKDLGTNTWETFSAQLPSLIMWLYLPPEDVRGQPNSRKAPVLIVCRPTYSAGYPNAFARLSHINIYTTNAKTADITNEIGGDILGMFYSKLENYTSDPEQPEVADDVSFVPTYSCWTYGVIDIARNLARHESYFDCSIRTAPQYAASWTRPFLETINGVSTKAFTSQRNRMKHILARENLWGRVMQLLTVDYLQVVMNRPHSPNVASMLFNSVSTTDPVDIDSTSWRYNQVKQRVFEQVKFKASLPSELRKTWAFFYYNLSFSSIVLGAIRQKIGTPKWDNISMPCAVWLGTGAAAVLETWISIIDPAVVAPDPAHPTLLLMPVLIQGASVGSNNAQPVCFSVFDIVLIMELMPDFRMFYTENNQATYVVNQRFYDRYGITSGIFSSTQDPYARVTMRDFTFTRRERIVAFIGSLKSSGTDIDTERIFTTIADYNQESFERVAFMCAAFIISKTPGP